MTSFKSPEDASHSWLSLVLVATQFILMVFLMFAGPFWPTHGSLQGMMVLGGVIGLWAFLAMGLWNPSGLPGNSSTWVVGGGAVGQASL